MRIIDRYIIKSLIPPLVGCLATFVFLYIIIDLFGHLDEILKNKVAFLTLFDYYLSSVPIIFIQTAPIATLLSSIYVLGTLNNHNEVTALKAGGMSIKQVLRPFIILGLMMRIAIFLVNEKIVPQTQ